MWNNKIGYVDSPSEQNEVALHNNNYEEVKYVPRGHENSLSLHVQIGRAYVTGFQPKLSSELK